MKEKELKKYPKYKPSGVKWIGEIPEEWEIKKISHIFNKIGSGTTPTSGNEKYYFGSINWLQTGDLNNGEINETSKKVTEKALKDFPTLREYSKGSLVIAMYGATIGKLGLLNINSTTNQACCVLSEPVNLITKYVF
ncbi:MAG: restriction endonuclease subunit S [Bacteroidetes bacterium]|nr:restriction endonuclease subunit S [Bacteroidota bacterium]